MGINEIELQKLKRAKPSLTKKLIFELDEALMRLHGSTRYPFFENLQASRFFENGKIGVASLEELSFADLVNLGTVDICNQNSMGQGRIQQLISVIDQLLIEDEQEELASFPAVPLAANRPDPFSGEKYAHVPRYNSVEAERLLSDAISRLKYHPDFQSFMNDKIENLKILNN